MKAMKCVLAILLGILASFWASCRGHHKAPAGPHNTAPATQNAPAQNAPPSNAATPQATTGESTTHPKKEPDLPVRTPILE